jgi:hypothetical protein
MLAKGLTGKEKIMKRLMFFALTASLAVVLALTGCSSDSGGGKSVAITDVSCMSENIHPSFMDDPAGSTARYNFWVYYDGDIVSSDIEYVRIYSPDGGYWTIARQGSASYVDTANRVVGGLGHWSYDDAHLHMLPFGLMKAEIKLMNGVVASSDFNVYEPGGSTASANSLFYTESLAVPPPNSAPLLKRGTVGAVTKNASSIKVPFSVADARVYQARIWFYDASHAAAGQSPLLRDPMTGAIRYARRRGHRMRVGKDLRRYP